MVNFKRYLTTRFLVVLGFLGACLVTSSSDINSNANDRPNVESDSSGAAPFEEHLHDAPVSVLIEESPAHILLYSTFSWAGFQGNVTFALKKKFSISGTTTGTNTTGDGISGTTTTTTGNSITASSVTVVTVALEASLSTGEVPAEVSWALHEWPIRYDGGHKRCGGVEIGKVLVDLTKELGPLTLPMDGPAVFETDQLAILGDESIFSRSIVFKAGKQTSCSNIHGVGGEKTYEARYRVPMGGSVWFRSWQWQLPEASAATTTVAGTQVAIFSDVYNTLDDEPSSTDHDWQLFITDILDSRDYGITCNHLTRLYDPVGKEACDEEGCPQGMLGKRHGSLRVGSRRSRFSKKFYVNTNLELPEFTGPRQLYLGVTHAIHSDQFWSCAKLRNVKVKKIVARINSNGVKGTVTIEQASVFAPTDLTLSLNGLKGKAEEFHIHEMPFIAAQHPGENVCDQTLARYNPYNVESGTSPEAGIGTHDEYDLGDLSGKHGSLTHVETLEATVTDYNLPIFGYQSVVGRSIIIRNSDGKRWVCGNFRPTRPVVRAVVVFRYPLVGEILMEQDEEDSYEDTTLYLGPLVYSDGNHNTTGDHAWRIHEDAPGRDYYNWTGRCKSAGKRFNPYFVSVNERVYKDCGPDMPDKCELGDMVGRNGPLNIAGTIQRADGTRRLYTDTSLSLLGRYSVVGHSMVIIDQHALKHRGDRMACATIFWRYRHKGEVYQWSSTSGVGHIDGKFEFIQESPYDITTTVLNIKGLQGLADGYHIHKVQVEHELQFPCTDSAIYGHYNPLNVTPALSPPSSLRTDDLYVLGDLSGKYGTLENLTAIRTVYEDHNLPLFGHTSIMGRSVVVHKKRGNFRWFCGNIGWGYARSEATQVSAIASFHNPNGFAWGYIRMRQLLYSDGLLGETFLEVNLRHPGTNNRNVTRGHNWSVYVNPVGVDASVKFIPVRCTAAGYRWNPYLIHLAQPNAVEFYDKECTPAFPLRCEVGDLSGRLNTIDIGDKKRVFVDMNLPLAGEHSIMGKSIVIHHERGRVERFACANIEPDDDIVKVANIRRTPRFSPTTFMDKVREIMGAPEWYLQVDLSTVKNSADKVCVTFDVHFMGPLARKLEQDFTRLMATGKLPTTTIKIHGVHPDPKRTGKVSYRSCRGRGYDAKDFLEKESPRFWELLFSGSSATGGTPVDLHTQTVLLLLLLCYFFY